jgi:uncharacterized membrane protein
MAFVSSLLAIVLLQGFARYRTPFVELISDEFERREVLPWIITFGTLFFLGNMVYFNGIVKAPNAGYARALMTVEIILLTLLTALFFGSSLSARQVVGIFLVTVGAVVVSVG